jgi:hypothetical protein
MNVGLKHTRNAAPTGRLCRLDGVLRIPRHAATHNLPFDAKFLPEPPGCATVYE